MNAFKDEYPKKVAANAKAFARALNDCGLGVAGDPEISFTETHQVIINVGYAKAPEIARRLEENHIILNYQAAPDEESFSAAGSLRTGVQEMSQKQKCKKRRHGFPQTFFGDEVLFFRRRI
jgi:aminomethyltransferase